MSNCKIDEELEDGTDEPTIQTRRLLMPINNNIGKTVAGVRIGCYALSWLLLERHIGPVTMRANERNKRNGTG